MGTFFKGVSLAPVSVAMGNSQSLPRQLRILVIAPTSFFADYGCHVRIRGHVTALQARGHHLLLATYPSGRDVASIPTLRAAWPRGGPIQVGSSWLKLILDALLTPTVLSAAIRFRPHILHAYLHEGALIGVLVARLLRRPLVFDYQGSLTGEMLDHGFIAATSPWLRPLHWLEHWIERQPGVILASSQLAARLLTERYGVPSGQVIILPDSVDPNVFRPASSFSAEALVALRNGLGIPPGRQVIVYLGLLARYQGTDLLLQALASLVCIRPHVHLLLMGFPFLDRYRAMAARLQVTDHVTFTGAVPYEDAPRYLALGQVAVAPKLSATEGSGKVLTYMAAGLPVAAFDTPVHREYLGDEGVYAPAGDAEGLAAALASLLADPEGAAARGRALRQRVIAAYTWEHAAAVLETAYGKVLDRSYNML